ncbi:FKBP-type peptidyl-prolyl cis-trans isomerase [Actinomyces faecalis]|uniref:FKBP-type peptidyl-prolyl cis-trans isomerase n=1 Tax=Actinomyces faecalis TaxID=2722820 RepID=UPI0015580926|nr:FKBP-type peptidyl-prolyl cis-trans isomerase [Actinomyces faecalis]
MRRAPLALSALVLSAALALTGCSGSGSAKDQATASASAAATAPQAVDCAALTIDGDSDALPTVNGEAGSQPTLAWSGQDAPANLTVRTLDQGSGAEVKAADFVTVSYAGWQWGSDEVFDSSYQRGAQTTFGLNQVITGWRCGLVGQHVGDRVVMSIPADQAYGDDASNRVSGPLVFVVEISATGSSDELAAGTAGATMEGEQALADRGLAVSGDLGAAATVSVNDGAAEPTEVETILVARGSGPEITAESSLLVHMAFTSWDGSSSQSTWDAAEPQTVSMANAPGLTGLVGMPVGSRVVVLVPASAGTNGAGPVPAQAYVVDVEQAV